MGVTWIRVGSDDSADEPPYARVLQTGPEHEHAAVVHVRIVALCNSRHIQSLLALEGSRRHPWKAGRPTRGRALERKGFNMALDQVTSELNGLVRESPKHLLVNQTAVAGVFEYVRAILSGETYPN